MSTQAQQLSNSNVGYVRDSIHALRQKLLDMTNRNPLLNFRHGNRSVRLLRVIDELPDQLFEKLSADSSMSFRSLGIEETIPQDEKTINFQRALDAAKLNDLEYLAAVRELGEEAGEKLLERLEIELRVRLRERLGMPARRTKSQFTIQEVAQKQGLDPSFDLPFSSATTLENRESKHNDSVIQTLLYSETMDRVLFNIREHSRLSIDETGVNPLFCVFGFLEWYEDANSEIPLHAPLLLLPLEIQRELMRGNYQYRVRGVGEGAMINVALAERLKKDFDITLPPFNDDDTPEAYFVLVQNTIEKLKGWKVRRWITIGLFSFARITMYHDLDPKNWTASGGIENHPKIRRILTGEMAGPAATRQTDFEEKEMVDDLEQDIALIADADSSQLRAVRDVLSKRDLVIEGPPGTGKSQTITNIIAAALARGQTVLFLAEKMAALSVVKDRLTQAGLDDFCLELHSTKAGRKETAEKLAARLARVTPKRVEDELQSTLRLLGVTKSQLQKCMDELAKPAGRLSCTVQELLWRCHQIRELTSEVPTEIDELTFPDALEITEPVLDRMVNVATQFEACRQRIKEGFGSIQQHPWLGIAHSNLDPISAEDVIRRVRRLENTVSTLCQSIENTIKLTNCRCNSVADLTELAKITAISPPAEGIDEIIIKLSKPQTFAKMSQFNQELDAYLTVEQQASSSFASSRDMEIASAELFQKIADQAESQGLLDKTASEIKSLFGKRHREIEEWSAIASLLKEIALTARVDESITAEGERWLVSSVELAAQADTSLLSQRLPEYLQSGVAKLLEAKSQTAFQLKEKRKNLQEKYVLDMKPEPMQLRIDAAALRSAPFLPFLSSAWRRARKNFLGLSRSPTKLSNHEMASVFDEMANHIASTAAFEQDDEVKKLLGASFKGIDSEFEQISKVATWAEKVRHQFPVTTPIGSQLRKLLLEGSIDQLQSLAQFSQHPRLANLKKAHASDPGAKRGVLEFVELARSRARTIQDLDSMIDKTKVLPSWSLSKSREVTQQLATLRRFRDSLTDSEFARSILGEAYQGVKTPTTKLKAALGFVEAIGASKLPTEIKTWLTEMDALNRFNQLTALCKDTNSQLEQFNINVRELNESTRINWELWVKAKAPDTVELHDFATHLWVCISDPESLQLLVEYERVERDAREVGLGRILYWLEKSQWNGTGLRHICRRVCYQSLARDAIAHSPALASFTGDRHEANRQQFRELDKQLLRLRQKKIAADLMRKPVDQGNGTGPRGTWTDLALIQNEMVKQKRHISVRALLDRASTAVQQLMPCFMMSPLSVSQYLKPSSIQFDLVVMDEASQLRPEDAIGAIARSRQVVVVGDPKQLPPTSFFMGADTIPDDDELETVANESSILDASLQVMSPARRLKWHYRSRHSSLIAFSNHEFYGDELVIFPTPQTNHDSYGIRYHFLENGIYGEGVNPVEARSVAEKSVEYVMNHLDRSLGIVTLNQKQCDLVKLEIDRIASENPGFETWRKKREESLEPFFVKNLENVQGDERDTIVISTVYGKDEKGNFFQRFGPINGQSGHRRLNVLFTRAKCQILVYSSMDPSDINVNEKSSWGLRALKGFLKFAKDGFYEEAITTGREPDSDFEISVANVLKAENFQVVPQVGVVGYFIDMAIVHPQKPGEYLLGIECDGASYHSGKSVRDRDRLRQEILERLKWRIHRIWSLDWYRNPKKERAKLISAVKEALTVSI